MESKNWNENSTRKQQTFFTLLLHHTTSLWATDYRIVFARKYNRARGVPPWDLYHRLPVGLTFEFGSNLFPFFTSFLP
jgi:hypothetical protein